MTDNTPNLLSETGQIIMDLAEQSGVSYRSTSSDAWAQEVTRLADDEVVLDGIELLLIELQRAGHLSRPAALRLQGPPTESGSKP
jgi:hypothetical protein